MSRSTGGKNWLPSVGAREKPTSAGEAASSIIASGARMPRRMSPPKAAERRPPGRPYLNQPAPTRSASNRPNRAATAAMMVIEIRKEAPIARITLPPMYPTKSPALPGRRTIGAKASMVVSVEASSGPPRWPMVFDIASRGAMPRSQRLRISSTTTIALSMSSPSAMIMPKIDIWCSAPPVTWMPNIAALTVSGTARPTISAARQPIVRKTTTVTTPTPASRFPASSSSRLVVYVD